MDSHEGNHTLDWLKKTTVAVAAPEGLIGSIICELLEDEGINFFEIPPFRKLSSGEICASIPPGPVVLINCSGRTGSREDPSLPLFMLDNVATLEKLLNAFRGNLVTLFHFSTWLVESPSSESSYVQSKLQAEKLLIAHQKQFGFSAKIIRLPTIWSSKSLKAGSLLQGLVSSFTLGEPLSLSNPSALCQIASDISLKRFFEDLLKQGGETVFHEMKTSWRGEAQEISRILFTKFLENQQSTDSEIDFLFQICLSWSKASN